MARISNKTRKQKNTKRNKINKNIKNSRNSRYKKNRKSLSPEGGGLFGETDGTLYREAAKIINNWDVSKTFEHDYVFEYKNGKLIKKPLKSSMLIDKTITDLTKLKDKDYYKNPYDMNKNLLFGLNYYNILTRINEDIFDYIVSSKYYTGDKKNKNSLFNIKYDFFKNNDLYLQSFNKGIKSSKDFESLELYERAEFYSILANIHFDEVYKKMNKTSLECWTVTKLAHTLGKSSLTGEQVKQDSNTISKMNSKISESKNYNFKSDPFDNIMTSTSSFNSSYTNPLNSSSSYSYSSDSNSFKHSMFKGGADDDAWDNTYDSQKILSLALTRIFEPINLSSRFKNKFHIKKDFLKKSFIDNTGIDFLEFNNPIYINSDVSATLWRGFISLREARKNLIASIIKNIKLNPNDKFNVLKTKINEVISTINNEINKENKSTFSIFSSGLSTQINSTSGISNLFS